MELKLPGMIAAACFVGWAAVAAPDERIGVGTPISVHFDRAADWYTKKELDKAISEYDEVIRLDPTSASAFCGRALVWFERKDYDRAIADDSEAIRLDPKHAWAFNNRGNARAAKNEFVRALADYDEAIRLDPSLAVAYRNRAWILANGPAGPLRDGKKAVESASRGCDLTDWKDPNYLDTLAASYAEAGDFDAAVRTQSRAIELVKDFDTRLRAYQDKKRHRDTAETAPRLSQSSPWTFSAPARSRSFFIVPYDAMLSLRPAGGSAGAVTEFGMGTSEARHLPIFTGLPRAPHPDGEVKVGFVVAGSELTFYEKTEWGEVRWAFSRDTRS
jgi:tetratricopeptide (TPR) repeat protein